MPELHETAKVLGRERGRWSNERVNMTSAAELIATKAISKAASQP